MDFAKILGQLQQAKPFEEGRMTKITDGISEIAAGITLTVREISLAPLRIAGRMIDGILSNSSGGILPMSVGMIQGTIEGIKVVGNKTGLAIERTSLGLQSISSGLISAKPTEKFTNKEWLEGYEVIDEK